MDFGKDEVTVSSAITAPLHCFLLNLNAAARSEKKKKKNKQNNTFATLVYSETHSEQSGSENSSPGLIQGKSPQGKTRASLQHKPFPLNAL